MTVARGTAARDVALDVVRLRLCLHRDRITRKARAAGIALTAVCDERQRHARLVARHHDVGNAIRRRTKVGMQAPNRGRSSRRAPADPCDQLRGTRIDGRPRDLEVPPVRDWKHLPAGHRLGKHRGQWHGAHNGNRQGDREQTCGSGFQVHRVRNFTCRAGGGSP
jgi:hypothetical protein